MRACLGAAAKMRLRLSILPPGADFVYHDLWAGARKRSRPATRQLAALNAAVRRRGQSWRWRLSAAARHVNIGEAYSQCLSFLAIASFLFVAIRTASDFRAAIEEALAICFAIVDSESSHDRKCTQICNRWSHSRRHWRYAPVGRPLIYMR